MNKLNEVSRADLEEDLEILSMIMSNILNNFLLDAPNVINLKCINPEDVKFILLTDGQINGALSVTSNCTDKEYVGHTINQASIATTVATVTTAKDTSKDNKFPRPKAGVHEMPEKMQ